MKVFLWAVIVYFCLSFASELYLRYKGEVKFAQVVVTFFTHFAMILWALIILDGVDG